jgi:hypothetical protein
MTMTPTHVNPVMSSLNSIPLLDASNLPAADDWALLEAIQADAELVDDIEPDFDRFGRFRVAAAFDE